MTVFKDIPGYEGYYQAGTDGTIRSVDKRVRQWSGTTQLKRGKVLSPATDKAGYRKVALSRHNKLMTYPVHRLVAMTHIPNPLGYKEINHKDGVKANNSAENLEWCDRSHNIKHAIKSGLLTYPVGDNHRRTLFKSSEHSAIKEMNESGLNAPEIARLLGCSHYTIYRILAKLERQEFTI